jgi:hypothetical protein
MPFSNDTKGVEMRDVPQTREAPEKEITKTPEKRINTYDDLGAGDATKGIEDLRRPGNEKPISTYDDLRAPNDGADKTNATKVSDSRGTDGPELIEQRRIGQAAEGIRGQEWMKPEKWKTLSDDEKRIALDYSGKELGRAYKSPEPPLTTEKTNQNALGSYEDGATIRNPNGDYGIRMNEHGVGERNEKLFGDDPKTALETYSHEFRHSYQNEQAHAYDKGFAVDNPGKAREWSENLKDYKQPPDAEMARTDPERYFKEYGAYRNQPVEVDARDFGDKVTSKTYDDRTEGDLR